jgi:anti-sigma factor RsiW
MTKAPDSLQTLQAALDGLASALERGRADDVLSAEAPLAAAMAELSATDLGALAGQTDSGALGAGVDAVRTSLFRCVRLGRTSASLLDVISPRAAYGRGGTLV